MANCCVALLIVENAFLSKLCQGQPSANWIFELSYALPPLRTGVNKIEVKILVKWSRSIGLNHRAAFGLKWGAVVG